MQILQRDSPGCRDKQLIPRTILRWQLGLLPPAADWDNGATSALSWDFLSFEILICTDLQSMASRNSSRSSWGCTDRNSHPDTKTSVTAQGTRFQKWFLGQPGCGFPAQRSLSLWISMVQHKNSITNLSPAPSTLPTHQLTTASGHSCLEQPIDQPARKTHQKKAGGKPPSPILGSFISTILSSGSQQYFHDNQNASSSGQGGRRRHLSPLC